MRGDMQEEMLTCRTFPVMTESMASAGAPDASIAALLASAASSTTVMSLILPPKAPKGVRLAATMKDPLLTKAAAIFAVRGVAHKQAWPILRPEIIYF